MLREIKFPCQAKCCLNRETTSSKKWLDVTSDLIRLYCARYTSGRSQKCEHKKAGKK